MYYGGIEVTCYNDLNNTNTTCPKDSNGNFLELDDVAKNLIDNHTWNIGAMRYISRTNTLTFYQAERGSVHGKSSCSSGNQCNDTIIRTTEWTGYIALPYVTDWAYASSENDCNAKIDQSSTYKCKNNNWMHHGTKMDMEDATWFMSSVANPGAARHVWAVFGVGNVNGGSAAGPFSVFPTIYLKSNILIESGNGTSSDPYVLKLGN